MNHTLLHGLMKLVQDTAVKAQWDLALAVPAFTLCPSEVDIGHTVN